MLVVARSTWLEANASGDGGMLAQCWCLNYHSNVMIIVADILYIFAAVCLSAGAGLADGEAEEEPARGGGSGSAGVRIRPSERPRIWIHAVSLGEINATPFLVEYLKALNPEADVVVSTTTDTGYARACKLYDPECVFGFR